MSNIFKEFKQKHVADGRVLQSKSLDLYLDYLNYDPCKVLHDLDEEIQVIKRQTELQKQAKAEEI